MQGSLALDIAAVPTKRMLTQVLCKAKRGKGPGLDGLVSEIFRAAPHEAARLLHPLLVKSSLQVQQPLALRGGLLVSFYKGKGPMNDYGSHRAILLASNVAKARENVLFPAVQQALADLAPTSMCGGIARRGTDFASHIMRAFSRLRSSEYFLQFDV